MTFFKYILALILASLGAFSAVSHCLVSKEWVVGCSLAAGSFIAGFIVFYFASQFIARSNYFNFAKNIYLAVIVLGAISSIDMFFSGSIAQFSMEVCFTAGAAFALTKLKATPDKSPAVKNS